MLQYNLPFYLQYLAKWPEYCLVAEAPGCQCMGYILGKAEGVGEGWHGHVTAVTVAPDFRLIANCVQVLLILPTVQQTTKWSAKLRMHQRCCMPINV